MGVTTLFSPGDTVYIPAKIRKITITGLNDLSRKTEYRAFLYDGFLCENGFVVFDEQDFIKMKENVNGQETTGG